jgi:hypothetical protein
MFNEYKHLTAGRWGAGGCRCRQCARRVPRVLEFSLAEDVKKPLLERGTSWTFRRRVVQLDCPRVGPDPADPRVDPARPYKGQGQGQPLLVRVGPGRPFGPTLPNIVR